jgi:DNA-binding XRE family transcriptional regulator
MNLGKSIKIALLNAGKDKDQAWLADQIGVSRTWMTAIANRPHSDTKHAEKIASVLGMKTSELIALGEDKE